MGLFLLACGAPDLAGAMGFFRLLQKLLRGQTTYRTVRPYGTAFNTPVLYLCLCIFKAQKAMLIKAFVAETTVERLDKRIVWRYEMMRSFQRAGQFA
jgi:hypothetical protein